MKSPHISPEIDMSINTYDSYYFKLFVGRRLSDIIDELFKNLDDDWGFPLELSSVNKNFYSSVTSTILIALHNMNLVDPNFKNKIYDCIFKLQNQYPNKIKKEKSSDDSPAWDISESANCYSTSLALQALIETDYKGTKTDIIQESLIWLSQQQREDGGWGFDKECVSRVFFSAQVVYTLSIGTKFIKPCDENRIKASISTGMNFIKKEMHVENNKFAYWSAAVGEATPDPTNTLYALWILNRQKLLDENIKKRAFCFLREEMNNDGIWDFNEVVKEINSKYGSNKTIITFSPSFPLILLELGVSPFDDLCLKPISWLKNNYKNNWHIPQYNSIDASFVRILGLWTLIKWQRHANKYVLTNSFDNEKIVRLKQRINSLITIVIIFIIILIRNPIIGFIGAVNKLIHQQFDIYGTIPYMASLIGIILFVLGVIKYIPIILKYIDSRFLKNKLKIEFNNLRDKIDRIIYDV